MTATDHAGAPEGVAQDIEAPVAEQAAVGPLTGDPAIVGVPTFVVGSVMLGLALINYAPAAGGALPIIILATGIGQLLATVWARRWASPPWRRSSPSSAVSGSATPPC